MRQIGIIGGGASGMMAAIAASNTSIKDTEITRSENSNNYKYNLEHSVIS